MTGTAAIASAVAADRLRERELLERLNAELLSSHSATVTLGKWCAARGLSDPAGVRAEVDPISAVPTASPELLARLQVRQESELRHRRVRLMCGPHVLSEATNWYVPARLSPSMNAALAKSNAPFGRLILPLSPIRHNLSVTVVQPDRDELAGTVLRHHTLVLDGEGCPLAEVLERYQAVLLTDAGS